MNRMSWLSISPRTKILLILVEILAWTVVYCVCVSYNYVVRVILILQSTPRFSEELQFLNNIDRIQG